MSSWQKALALSHRSWRESRAIFAACMFITFINSWLAFDRSYEAVLAKRLVDPSPFEILDGTYRVWAILFSVLGAGCLLWERRQGGAAFSLTLPVRHAHFNLIRAAVGIAQVAVIAWLPTYIAGSIHQAIRPILQAPTIPAFTLIGIALGISSFGLGYLFSSFVTNLYLAIGISWVTATAISQITPQLGLTENLASMTMLRRLGSYPAHPIAWPPVCLYTFAGLLFIVAGAYIAERRSLSEVR